MKIGVIGTGYVGLVTGTCLAEVGHDVTCLDIDKQKIAKLKKGQIPIFEPGLAELVIKNHTVGRLAFTTKVGELGQPQAIVFALPTPPNGDGQADLSYLLSAAQDFAKTLKKYTVLVNKSTVPVGTTQKVTDVVAGLTKVPFDVVSNPEFLREGFAVDDFMQSDRIVVGTTSAKAKKVMQQMYAPFIKNGVPLLFMDESSSEMTKYAANSFLATKISFMNEIANMCERVGANVEQVRAGIGVDTRIGSKFLQAGIGYGGSCFPKDVLALSRSAHTYDYDFKILTAVMEVNQRQRERFVKKVIDHFGSVAGKHFALWGLAFKADTDDIREAPSLEVIKALLAQGATITAYDPAAADNVQKVVGDTIAYAASAQAALKKADALLIVTDWKEFVTVNLETVATNLEGKVIFDGRNLYDPALVKAAGLTYVSTGRKTV